MTPTYRYASESNLFPVVHRIRGRIPRYYFNVRHRTLVLDTEGIVPADDAEAWKQATTAYGEMMRDLKERSSAVLSGAWVVDEADRHLFTVRFGGSGSKG